MSSYSGLERNIARVLGHFPVIKRFSKACYSRLAYVGARKKYKIKSVNSPVAYTLDGKHSFFGYYDKSPENARGWVLAQVSPCSTEDVPSIGVGVEVVVFDADGNVLVRAPVDSYNLQQGCRAHWLDDDKFIFNDFDNSRRIYISRVFSVSENSQVKVFDFPVQDSFDKNYLISLNYRRLMALRPDYGYRNLPCLSSEELSDLENDGLWRVDYETGKSRVLISLSDACKINPVPDFSQASHKFNHVMISPSGRNFIFMHRYLLGQRRHDRLLLANAETGAMTLLSDYGMVSHCFWVDDSTVLGYLRGPDGKDGYWLIDVESGRYKMFEHEKLSAYGDGHPHVSGDWFVTDTYPDKARMQHLILCNWKTGEIKEIGEFFHGFEYSGESRCDLHPRFSPDGKAVFFDSVFSGKRQLYRMELSR